MSSFFVSLFIGLLGAISVYLLLSRHLLRSLIGFGLLSNAINLYLFCSGAWKGTHSPYTFYSHPSDPLPQALVLTAIVISMGALAFLLGLFIYFLKIKDVGDSNQIDELRGP